jgi:hypothetical protein
MNLRNVIAPPWSGDGIPSFHPLSASTRIPTTVSTRSILHVLLLTFAVAACDEPFSSGAYEPHMVVFSVLSTDREAQFVRVYTNYMPPGEPAEYTTDNPLTDAVVTVTDQATSWTAHDTLLIRPDTGRYASPLHAYVISPFVPEYGKSYTVQIQSPSFGTATGTAVIPAKAEVDVDATTSNVLRIPFRFTPSTPIQFSVRLSELSKAYIVRFYIYYDVLKDGEWVEERMEVPVAPVTRGSYTLDNARYGKMTLRRATANLNLEYENGFYQEVIRELTTRRYKDHRIIYKWVVLSVLQMDENLYRYYTSVHEYQDPRSVRLDEPFYSTVRGAYGMVGGYALDSLFQILPANFDGNR